MSPRPLLLVLACAGLFASCPGGGLVTKLCGGPGQPCCEGSTCDQGARCATDGLCSACGQLRQQCCDGDVCAEGATCSIGQCVEPLTCGTACTLGEARCSPTGGIEACTSAGVCPTWRSVVTTCPSGTVCEAAQGNADCADRCPTTCNPDTLWCTVSGPQKCVLAAGATCPTLVPESAEAAVAACPPGAAVDGDGDFSWESPAPFGTPIKTYAGDFDITYWAMDVFGNVLHYDLGTWTYELRSLPDAPLRALTQCDHLPGFEVAVGRSGQVWRRRAGTWKQEPPAPASDLTAVACDFNTKVYATDPLGHLYVAPPGGPWTTVDAGPGRYSSGIAVSASTSSVLLYGSGTTATRCTGLGSGPLACGPDLPLARPVMDPSGWVEQSSGGVFLADGHTLQLRNNYLWSVYGTSDAGILTTLTGMASTGPSLPPTLVAGTGAGAIVVWDLGPNGAAALVSDAGISAVHTVSDTKVLVGDLGGRQWVGDVTSRGLPTSPRGGSGPTRAELRGVSGLGHGRLFAVGENGERLRRENGAWLGDRAGYATTAALFDVDAINNGEVYAVGEGGLVLVRRYGTWTREAEGLTTATLRGVTHDVDTVYVVGEQGTWLEKSRSAGTWQRRTASVPSVDLTDVALSVDLRGKAMEVAAVGRGCTIVIKQGATLTSTVDPTCLQMTSRHDLNTVAFTSDGVLLVAGEYGYLAHRTTTGFAQEYLSLVSDDIHALVSSATSTWAVTSGGGVFRRSGTWTEALPNVVTQPLWSGFADPQGGVYFVGGAGTIIRHN